MELIIVFVIVIALGLSGLLEWAAIMFLLWAWWQLITIII